MSDAFPQCGKEKNLCACVCVCVFLHPPLTKDTMKGVLASSPPALVGLVVLLSLLLLGVSVHGDSDEAVVLRQQPTASSGEDTPGVLLSREVRDSFALVERLWRETQPGRLAGAGVGDYSFKCALCGIVINEVEGMLLENRTEEYIEGLLRRDVCEPLGGGTLSGVCDMLVDLLPSLVKGVEHRWDVNRLCVEDLKMCERPFSNTTDNQPVPSVDINLDLPPQQRWQAVCSQPKYGAAWNLMINTLAGVLPKVAKDMATIGSLMHEVLPQEIRDEITGCSTAMGTSVGWATLLNVGYEVSDACTSIVAALPDGTVLHGRNLDFWAGMGFTNTLKELAFEANIMKGGKLLYKSTTFAGYVGVLSGMKPGAFSVTIDTRFYPEGPLQMLEEILVALRDRQANLVALLTRKALEETNNYDDAMQMLSYEHTVADVYYIVAGAGKNQGAVISRDRTKPADVWPLDLSTGRWFVLETNYDHWKPAPWYDDRRTPGNEAMNQMGQQHLTLDGLYNVLSTKPVFNLQTTYTILAVPSNGTYTSHTRYCPYPCTQ